MNSERCLLAGEALGLGYAALEKAARYAQERVIFGRPIGQNQGIQHPLAAAYMNLEAAKHATYHAARVYDSSGKDPSVTSHAVGVACNSAKYVAAEAAFTACEQSVSRNMDLGTGAADGHRFWLTVGWDMLRNIMWRDTCESVSFLE